MLRCIHSILIDIAVFEWTEFTTNTVHVVTDIETWHVYPWIRLWIKKVRKLSKEYMWLNGKVMYSLTNDISIELEICPKLAVLWLIICSTDHKKFVHATTVWLSWRVQNFVVIGWTYVKPERSIFWSTFEFQRNTVCGAWSPPRVSWGFFIITVYNSALDYLQSIY